MSLEGKRRQIADALTNNGGLQGFPTRPTAPNTGDAWPMFAGLVHADGDAFTVNWVIRIVAPQGDEYAAEKWWDMCWPAIYYALKPVGYVSGAEPVELQTNVGSLLAYQIMMQAEE